MATSYTSLLGFALPVQGELSGSWGDVVNDSITQLVEDSVAGVATADVSASDWTLTTTGSGAANEARCAILIPTGTPGTSRNIVAPSSSKAYIVINKSDAAVVVKGSATSGVSLAAGATDVVAWDGSDFVRITQSTNGDVVGPSSATDNAVARFDSTTGKLIQNSAVTIADDGTTVISTNSTDAALRITQTGTGNALLVEDAANPDSTPFVVDASGQIISGATEAVTMPNYSGTSTTPRVQISATGTGGSIVPSLAVGTWASGTSGSTGISGFKSRSGTAGSHTIVNDGDDLLAITALGSDGTGFIRAASILAEVDGTPGTNDMPGRLVFSTTADGASTPTERYRIASDGKHTYTGYAALTNSTNNDAFTITNTGTGNSFVVEDSTSPDSTPFVITGTGNILKGTSTSYSFGASTAGFQSHSVSGDVAGLGLVSWQTGSNTAASLWFGRGDSGVVGNFSDAVDGNDVLGNIRFQGSDGTAFVEAAIIKAEVDGTPGTNDMPGRLVFSTTADGASTPTERMRITSTGVAQFKYATQETKTAIAASAIDLSTGNYFTKTISGATTFTVSNVASSGLVSAFVLDLTNGGAAAVTWFSGLTWNAGTAPTLTASGVDTLGFFTYDGGTTWRGFVLGQAMA